MKKIWLVLGVSALLLLPLGCAKKKTGGDDGKGTPEGNGGANVEKFDEGTAAFREAVKYISVTPDKAKATEAAGRAEAAFGEVAKAYAGEPPERYQGDNDWGTRITTLKKLMGDIKGQVSADKTAEAEASILETQKQLLQLDEKSKINTAGDEAIRLLVLCEQMDKTLREKRFNDMKHLMPSMREAQKNFFGSSVPPSARGREDDFDKAKDDVYEGVEMFAEAENPEARASALKNLTTATRKFYVEFG